MIEIKSIGTKEKVIPMYKMKPYQIGIVVEGGMVVDHIVMRTASEEVFEVLDLSDAKPGGCWTDRPNILVKLLEPGHKVTLEISND